MKSYFVALCPFILLCLVACNQKPVSLPEATDPLSAFQAISKACEVAIAPGYERSMSANGVNWARELILTEPIKYDVRKADSLVSPYVAYIEILLLQSGVTGNSEAAVKAVRLPEDATISTTDRWRLNFAYQNSKWKHVETRWSFAIPAAGIQEGAMSDMDFKNVVQKWPAAAACLPAS